MSATCKTCGGSPGRHKPSMLDPLGIGDPAHAMTTKPQPTPSVEEELEFIVLPDIFRSIGPGDDVVVSTEKVLAWRDEAVGHGQIYILQELVLPLESKIRELLAQLTQKGKEA